MLLGDSNLRIDPKNRRRSGSSIVVLGDDSLSQLPIGAQNQPDIMTTIHHQENGQHREMAVDVPESFIAQNKTQPRYPPPRNLNNHQPPAKPHIDEPPPPVSVRPIPPPRDHIPNLYINDGRHIGPPVQEKKPNSNKIGQILEPTPDQLDSIKKFQEQLRQRRENQDRIIAQNEFLRNSVRGSRKLQSLEANPLPLPPAGFINDAYSVGDDEMIKFEHNIMGEGSNPDENLVMFLIIFFLSFFLNIFQ